MNTDTKSSWFMRIAHYIICAYFITFPFVTTQTFLFGGTSFRSVSLIFVSCILFIFLFLFLLKKDKKLVVPKSPAFVALGVYFVSLIVSAFFGLSFHTSFWSLLTRTSGIWYLFHLGLFMYTLWYFLSDKKRYNVALLSIIFSSALFSFLAFLGPEGLGLVFKTYRGDGFTFGNSSFTGMYLFGSFLLSIYYILQSEKKKIWMYFLPLLILINPYTISKTIWFGNFSNIVGEARMSAFVTLLSVIGLLLFFGISKIKNKKIFRNVSYGMFGLLVVGIVMGAISLLSDGGFLREKYLSQATPARPIVWNIAEKAMLDRPFFGWGTDTFDRVFEKYYDNKLLEDKYGAEPWFDRPHNIFLEQGVDNGFIGLTLFLLVYVVILLSLLYVFVNTQDRRDRILSVILFVYFSLHIAELQTVFDTTISYPMLAFMFVSAVLLYQRTRGEVTKKSQEIILPDMVKYVVFSSLAVFCVWSFVWGVVPFVRAQNMNGFIRTVGSAEKRIPVYPVLFSSRVDPQAFLWRTVTDFKRGIGENPKVLDDPKKFEKLKIEASIFEDAYREYVKNNPTHFRAKLGFADLLVYQTLFVENNLEEAQTILDEAMILVPTSPQPYWIKAVSYIYMRKFDLAREYAKKGWELNPDIKESAAVIKYVESSIETFPNIGLFIFK